MEETKLDPKLWVINGKRYDFTKFVSLHPGGKHAIDLGKGRDCTELFESYHLLSDFPHSLLEKYYVDDCAAKSLFFDWDNTPFFDDVKKATRIFFRNKSPKASWSAVIEHSLTCCATLISLHFWLQGYIFAIFAFPLFYWFFGSSCLHIGSHFAMSKYPWINVVTTYIGGLHVNYYVWLIQHSVGHHSYTNINDMDPDLNHFLHIDDTAPGYRMHPSQNYLQKYARWRFAVCYQSFATTLALSFLLLPKFLEDRKVSGITPIPERYVRSIKIDRIFIIFLVVLCLFKLSLFKGLLFVFASWGIHGVIFYVFSQISHINEASMKYLPSKDKKIEWAELMILTATDYGAGSKFWGFASNYLNLQVIHHIFPGVHPCHYEELREMIVPIAKKHGIDYAGRSSFTFWQTLTNYFDWIRKANDL